MASVSFSHSLNALQTKLLTLPKRAARDALDQHVQDTTDYLHSLNRLRNNHCHINDLPPEVLGMILDKALEVRMPNAYRTIS
ncbi:hypothetical protein BDV98DRAFT_570777 [Pterulicium gracile]|uniref:Uncharacterized protein n=1 Tax=Pterulicium gracile TaxID=1884261 RepID=A0A5C3QCH4_9AGAR|nr:hypothetical protein BDV98DRAFT_570777 [Pterula gracilis]